MQQRDYILTNIGQLTGILEPGITCLKGKDMAQVGQLQNAWLLVRKGCIEDFGSMSDLPSSDVPTTDLQGKWVMPGFVDSHTHMVFAGPRHREYVMRLSGKSYEEIAAAGGGILNSAARLRNTSEEDLFESAMAHAQEAIQCGTTALEIKSGYGLDTASELKMLRVIKRLKESLAITIKATFLGAHAFPPEFRNDHGGYLRMIKEEMLPEIAKDHLADFIDVFCDRGFFSPEETAEILTAGMQYGLKAKIHGNELGITGGVQVAVAHGALSVDHLEHIGDEEIECLKSGETMPVALPGSSFFLKIPYTPLRRMIDAGLPVALASDFNPGSSPVYNLWYIWSLACLYNGIMPAEGFNALTINAAKAMGLEKTHGSITRGKRACLMVTAPFESLDEMPYWLGRNHAGEVFY